LTAQFVLLTHFFIHVANILIPYAKSETSAYF
jgi:hypothetical protein